MSHFKLKKILIIKHGSLGDIISATSVLKDIRDNYLKDEIIILTSNKYKFFFLDSFLVNKILIDDRKGLLASISLVNKILKMNIDLVINLQNSRRTTIYELCFRLFTSAKINGTSIFSTSRYLLSSGNLPSVIDGLSNQIELLNIKCRRKPYLDWLNNHSFDFNKIDHKRLIIVNPGCSRNNIQKKWSSEKYSAICKVLISKNILPVLIGSKEDQESINFIEKKVKDVLNLCNKSPLNVVYQLSQKAIGAISNDTGPAHLIAASGCKIHLVLSSFSNVQTVIPQGDNVTYTQKRNIDNILPEEIINKLEMIFKI